MKIKKVVWILICLMLVGQSLSYAINSNETNFTLPDEKTVVNIQANDEIDTKVEKSTIENNKKKIYSNNLNSANSINIKKSKSLLKTAQEDKYKGEIIPNRDDICDTFVSRDGKHYTYTLDFNDLSKVSIDRYSFETNENERVYNNEDFMIPDYYYVTHNNVFIKNTIIFYSAFEKTDENHLHIFGYDTQTEEFVYSNTFKISKENYENSFCLDNNDNICIVTKGDDEKSVKISLYDKDANLISDSTQNLLEYYYSAKITYLNDKMIWIKAFILNGDYIYPYDVVIKIKNGVIDNTFSSIRNYGMDLNFLNEEETIAYDQYGELLQISYEDSEVEVRILDYIRLGADEDFDTEYKNSSDNQYIYAGGNNGRIIKYNWNTHEMEKVLSIGKNKLVIGVFKSDNKLFVEYIDSKYNVYALTIDYDEFNNPSQVLEITEHTTLSRTKEDIQAKYDELKIINKSNYNDVYAEEPSTVAPYKAGSLNDKIKTDTLNQINYFRWLAGVNEVTINENYMEHAQSGAVLLTTSPQLKHKPAQPSDMTDAFYKKAVGATNASIGVNMSANIGQNSPLAESIKGYVDDVNNMYPNVGHRLSILDYSATSTSFGYADTYGVVDMFLQWNASRIDDFTAWPSAGYFPTQSIDKNARWSIGFDNTKYYKSSDIEVTIKANNKEYSSKNNDFSVYFDSSYSTYYFAPPAELITYLTDGTNEFQTNKKVEVKLGGLADYNGNACVIKYPVQFISAIKYQKGDVNGDGKVNAGDYVAILNYVRKKITLTEEQLQRADANGDGKINAGDYVTVLNIVRGKI